MAEPWMNFETVEDEDGNQFPLVFALDTVGEPVPVTGFTDPLRCSHERAVYSSNLDMRCPHCGIPLFIPGRFLANKHPRVVEAMHRCWEDAGWPAWLASGQWGMAESWTREPHPLFEALGGLAVNPTRLESWKAKWGRSVRGRG